MSGTLETKPSISDYRAAVDKLEAAREAACSERGRVEVAGDVDAGAKNLDGLKLAINEFKAIRSKLSPQDLFVVEFNIEAVKPGSVSLVLPKGVSWMEYFERAQEVSRSAYERDAVYQGQLDTWRKKGDEESLRKNASSIRVQVQLCVEGTEGMPWQEQEAALQGRGLERPPGIHVMAGIIAFTMATGNQVTGDHEGPFVWVSDGYVMSAGRLGVYLTPALDDEWENVKIGVAGAPRKGSER